jgi:hypothetical protein
MEEQFGKKRIRRLKMIKQFKISIFPIMLLFLSCHAMADLILSEGGPTGQWYNPERGGEGFFVEITSGGTQQISVAMYTFDAVGNPLWVVGNVPIEPDDEIKNVEVFQFDGPAWGPDFDPDDLNTTPFGTITVRFPTCDTALFSVQTSGSLPSGDYSLIRLADVEGVDCTEPPDPPTGLTPGRWAGAGVCFTVSQDGTSIIGGNLSTCDAQSAFDSNLDGITNEQRNCKVVAKCEGVWPIEDGKFTCVNFGLGLGV